MINTILREKIKGVFKLENVALSNTLMPRLSREFTGTAGYIKETAGNTKRNRFKYLVNVVESDHSRKLVSDNIEKNRSVRFGKP